MNQSSLYKVLLLFLNNKDMQDLELPNLNGALNSCCLSFCYSHYTSMEDAYFWVLNEHGNLVAI